MMDGCALKISESGERKRSEARMEEVSEESEIWRGIEIAESYLVSGMFEDVATMATSVVEKIRCATEPIDDMVESIGMLFIQSLKELGRTREMLVSLEMLFGSLAEIPVQVFLTGACIQMSAGFASDLKPIFAEYLDNWKYADNEAYVLKKEDSHSSPSVGCFRQLSIEKEKYLELAEVYAMTLLSTALRNLDLAVSWTEVAELPEEKRQEMLRRLRSLQISEGSRSSPNLGTSRRPGQGDDQSVCGEDSTSSSGKFLRNPVKGMNGDEPKPFIKKSIHPSIGPLSDRKELCFRWFRTIRLKFSNSHLVIPSGKLMLLVSLLAFTCYLLRKRTTVLKRFLAGQVSSLCRALIDAWQLAFSVQVNPLAAVQPLPAALRGSR